MVILLLRILSFLLLIVFIVTCPNLYYYTPGTGRKLTNYSRSHSDLHIILQMFLCIHVVKTKTKLIYTNINLQIKNVQLLFKLPEEHTTCTYCHTSVIMLIETFPFGKTSQSYSFHGYDKRAMLLLDFTFSNTRS